MQHLLVVVLAVVVVVVVVVVVAAGVALGRLNKLPRGWLPSFRDLRASPEPGWWSEGKAGGLGWSGKSDLKGGQGKRRGRTEKQNFSSSDGLTPA